MKDPYLFVRVDIRDVNAFCNYLLAKIKAHMSPIPSLWELEGGCSRFDLITLVRPGETEYDITPGEWEVAVIFVNSAFCPLTGGELAFQGGGQKKFEPEYWYANVLANAGYATDVRLVQV
jgi:hypothetical protein